MHEELYKGFLLVEEVPDGTTKAYRTADFYSVGITTYTGWCMTAVRDTIDASGEYGDFTQEQFDQVGVAPPDDYSERPINLGSSEIGVAGFALRTYNSLKRAGINTVDQLTYWTEPELFSLRNFGQLSMNEVKDYLQSIGLRLGTPTPPGIGKRGKFAWVAHIEAIGLSVEGNTEAEAMEDARNYIKPSMVSLFTIRVEKAY